MQRGGHVGGYRFKGSSHGGVGGRVITVCQGCVVAGISADSVVATLVVRPPATVVEERPRCRDRRLLTAASLCAGDPDDRGVRSILDLVRADAVL
ncbi:hypothetical protein MRX96_012350 [Rhipicephalus microplus]